MLDEVDLILHPLKSELNWPMGRKEPLDFTRARMGNGLRWDVPFHLLDALFFASSGGDSRRQRGPKSPFLARPAYERGDLSLNRPHV